MQRTVVLDVVGLSRHLIGEHTPFLSDWIAQDAEYVPIAPVLPALTTTAQTTYATGKYPSEHGIVANGWYSREDAEVKMWKQSNHLVQAEKVWDEARRRDSSGTFTVAKTFWWYNMYSSADYSVTPRPCYPSDGRKLPDCYSHPADLRDRLQEKFGTFPLFSFWGPKSDIECSRWIANSAKFIEDEYQPTLQLVYLPHLDYCLQKLGTQPSQVTQFLKEIDDLLADLIPFFEQRGIDVMLLSEYGIVQSTKPVHINVALRKAGMIATRNELGRELLDCGASKAFAVSDHQIAHVYINDMSVYDEVMRIVRGLDGVDLVLDEAGKKEHHINHERAGDIVAVSKPHAWFTYYFWLDDSKCPDYARCVDIHRKPGYDPVELFVDPTIPFPTFKAGWKLLQKNLGFRYLMDLIPLDATLVQGSHGHLTKDPERGAMLATKRKDLVSGRSVIEPTEVYDLILSHLNL